MTALFLAADKKSMAYVAGDGNENFVVLDGKEGLAFDQVADLRFSPTGSVLAYRARRGLEHFVLVDGKSMGPYGEVEASSLVFSPDGKSVAWAGFRGRRPMECLRGRQNDR